MKLRWADPAMADRDAIFDYIAVDNPYAAGTTEDRIVEQGDLLIDFPEMGRPGRVVGTREIPVQRTPYLLIYHVDEAKDEVWVLHVLHGKQQWP